MTCILQPNISFTSFGDWGSSNFHQTSVANSIHNYITTRNASFNIVLGDNFYENGISSVNDSQWITKYKSLYNDSIPWYVILGNHDYYGNYSAQIDFTNYDQMWKMPSNNYVVNLPYLKLIMIDTQLLDPQCSIVSKNITSIQIKKKIYSWITNEVQTGHPNKIVIGHAGMYNVGDHGNCKELINNLFPILDKYNIRLYLHGHSHLFQYNLRNKLHMINCGSASKLSNPPIKLHNTYNIYYSLIYGFCYHTLIGDTLHTQFINQDGAVIYNIYTYLSSNNSYVDLYLIVLNIISIVFIFIAYILY